MEEKRHNLPEDLALIQAKIDASRIEALGKGLLRNYSSRVAGSQLAEEYLSITDDKAINAREVASTQDHNSTEG